MVFISMSGWGYIHFVIDCITIDEWVGLYTCCDDGIPINEWVRLYTFCGDVFISMSG